MSFLQVPGSGIRSASPSRSPSPARGRAGVGKPSRGPSQAPSRDSSRHSKKKAPPYNPLLSLSAQERQDTHPRSRSSSQVRPSHSPSMKPEHPFPSMMLNHNGSGLVEYDPSTQNPDYDSVLYCYPYSKLTFDDDQSSGVQSGLIQIHKRYIPPFAADPLRDATDGEWYAVKSVCSEEENHTFDTSALSNGKSQWATGTGGATFEGKILDPDDQNSVLTGVLKVWRSKAATSVTA